MGNIRLTVLVDNFRNDSTLVEIPCAENLSSKKMLVSTLPLIVYNPDNSASVHFSAMWRPYYQSEALEYDLTLGKPGRSLVQVVGTGGFSDVDTIMFEASVLCGVSHVGAVLGDLSELAQSYASEADSLHLLGVQTPITLYVANTESITSRNITYARRSDEIFLGKSSKIRFLENDLQVANLIKFSRDAALRPFRKNSVILSG